jgi:hypothetical protein
MGGTLEEAEASPDLRSPRVGEAREGELLYFRKPIPGSLFPPGSEWMLEATPHPARPEGPVRHRLPRAQASRTKVTFMFTR